MVAMAKDVRIVTVLSHLSSMSPELHAQRFVAQSKMQTFGSHQCLDWFRSTAKVVADKAYLHDVQRSRTAWLTPPNFSGWQILSLGAGEGLVATVFE